jgi:hypothetical protein
MRRSVSDRSRPGLPEGCPELWNWKLLKFIWRFDTATWQRIDTARVAHGADVPVIRLRSNREVAAFIASLPAGHCGAPSHRDNTASADGTFEILIRRYHPEGLSCFSS